MELIILAGGLGTRISEESSIKPKPMIEIGGKPIIWHIMKIYSHYGIKDFIVCCGYKGYAIKEYFNNYFLHQSDVTINLLNNNRKFHKSKAEDWNITLVDTGESTMTGGRLKRVKDFIKGDEFCMTYGDGVANVDIKKSIEFHKSHGKLATITAVYPPGRFGALNISNNSVINFEEKPKGDGGLINGGFFVLNKSVLEYIKNDETIWEQEPLKNLASDNELMAYEHKGFGSQWIH